MLQLHGYEEKLRKKYPQTKITISDCLVSLDGQPDQVAALKSSIQETLAEMTSETVKVEPGVLRLLGRKHIQDTILDDLKNMANQICLVCSDQDIRLHALNQEQATRAKQYIENKFGQKVISVSQQSQPVLQTNDWHEFTRTLLSECKNVLDVRINTTGTKIYVAMEMTKVDSVLRKIDDFIEHNSMQACSVSVDTMKATLVEKHLQSKITDIGKKHEHKLTATVQKVRPNEYKISVDVRKSHHRAIQTDMEALIHSIYVEEYKVEKPAMAYYFTTKPGESFVANIQEKHPTILQIGSVGPTKIKGPTTKGAKPRSSSSADSALLVDGPIKVYTVLGDITTRPVDAVVNVAGKHNKGRLCEAILKAGRR